MGKSAEVEDVVRLAGLRYESKARIVSGSSSEVWIVRTATGKVVVRFLYPKNGIEPRIAFEATVRRRLYNEGVRVAKLIAASRDFVDVSRPRPWIVDEYLSGKTYPRGDSRTAYALISRTCSFMFMPSKGGALGDRKTAVNCEESRTQ